MPRPRKKPAPAPKRLPPPATNREFAERLLALAKRRGNPRVLAWVEGLTEDALKST